jgi:hypothetical protein
VVGKEEEKRERNKKGLRKRKKEGNEKTPLERTYK